MMDLSWSVTVICYRVQFMRCILVFPYSHFLFLYLQIHPRRPIFSAPLNRHDLFHIFIEFAREAMACQTLDCQEILSIRWAKDDPNPVAQDSISRADKDALAALLDAKGFSTQSAPFDYPTDYTLPPSKRSKTGDDIDCPELNYPDTDTQYTDQHQLSVTGYSHHQSINSGMEMCGGRLDISAEVVETAKQSVAAPLVNQIVGSNSFVSLLAEVHNTLHTSSSNLSVPSSSGAQGIESNASVAPLEGYASLLENIEEKKRLLTNMDTSLPQSSLQQPQQGVCEIEDEDEEDVLWTAHTDPESGATYYYNSSTGESSWGAESSS